MREQPQLFHPRRQQHLAQRLAGAWPDSGQAAERWPVLDSRGAHAQLEIPLLHVRLRMAGLQGTEVYRLGRGCGERCPAAFGVCLPLPARSPADDLPAPVLAEHHLNQPASLARQHQRARERALFEHDRDSGVRLAQCFYHLRRVQRARRYDLAEHPVVCQPSRVPAVQLPLEGMLAIRRVAPHSEQRVPRL